MNAKLVVAAAAGFGGVAPSLLKLAVTLTASNTRTPTVNGGYLVGLLLFAVLGGGVALIWGETKARKAFYLGIGLPSMLQIAVTGVEHRSGGLPGPSLVEERAGETAVVQPFGLSLLSGTAYADPLPQVAEEPTHVEDAPPPDFANPPAGDASRTVQLRLGNLPPKTELIILSPDGGFRARESLESAAGDVLSFALPAGASQVLLRAGHLESAGYSLDTSPGSTTAFEVDLESRFWGGFLRAMGFESAEPYVFDIERTDLQPDLK